MPHLRLKLEQKFLGSVVGAQLVTQISQASYRRNDATHTYATITGDLRVGNVAVARSVGLTLQFTRKNK